MFEYQGQIQKPLIKLRPNRQLKKPKEIYADLKRDDSMTSARDFRVVKTLNMSRKEKKKLNVWIGLI